MSMFYKIRKSGFTLVELLIAMAVGAVIMTALYVTLSLTSRTSGSTDRRVITMQDARAVLDLMAMEIRMASLNMLPGNTPSIWNGNMVGACAGIALSPTNKGILINAGTAASRIGVAMDLPNAATNIPSGSIGNEPNEYIVYTYDTVNNIIQRNTNCGGNTTILGGIPPAGVASTVVRNQAAGVSLFRYFDRNNVEILPANLPANTGNIRRIMITIVADNAQADPGAAVPRRMIYSTNVIVRNHVLSP